MRLKKALKLNEIKIATGSQIDQKANENMKNDDKIDITLGANDTVSDIDAITGTIKFMLKNVKQDDPEFIEFVKKLIKPPSIGPLNLKNKGLSDFSQVGQSKTMDDKLQFKRNGFYIEAGAFDGETGSNSLFFEMQRNWTGLLIEPISDFYTKLVKNYFLNFEI